MKFTTSASMNKETSRQLLWKAAGPPGKFVEVQTPQSKHCIEEPANQNVSETSFKSLLTKQLFKANLISRETSPDSSWNKISFGGIPNSRNVLFLEIFPKRAAKPSAGNPVLTWPCTKDSQNHRRDLLCNLLRSHWTWLCFAARLPETFSGTFSGTLLNLTCLCTKASQTFSGTLSGTLLNLTWRCTKASRNLLQNLVRNLLRNLLRNPVEPDRRLHRSLPDLLRNLLRNPVEPDLALHQSLPEFSLGPSPTPCWTWPGSAPSQTFSRTSCSPEPALESRTFSGTLWPGSAPKPPRNLLRNPVEPDLAFHQDFLEPSRQPCWTWPGSAPKPPKPSAEPSLEPSPEPCWTWPGACTSAHRSYSGLKTPLAHAVGEKWKFVCWFVVWRRRHTSNRAATQNEAPTTDPTHPPLNPKRRIAPKGKPSEAYAVLWVR